MFDQETTDKLIKAALIQALGENNMKQMLDNIIDRILKTKVNEHGKAEYSTYGGSPKTPFLDWVLEDNLRNIVRQCIAEIVLERKEEIKASLQNAVISETGLSDMLTNMISNMADRGNIDIKMTFHRPGID